MENLQEVVSVYYQEKGLDTEQLDEIDCGGLWFLGAFIDSLDVQFERQLEE